MDYAMRQCSQPALKGWREFSTISRGGQPSVSVLCLRAGLEMRGRMQNILSGNARRGEAGHRTPLPFFKDQRRAGFGLGMVAVPDNTSLPF